MPSATDRLFGSAIRPRNPLPAPASPRHRWPPWLAALLTLTLIVTVEQIGEGYVRQEALQDERGGVLQQLGTLRARIEGLVSSNLLLVRGLTSIIRFRPDIDQATFARIGAGMVEGAHALRNIAGAPGMVISLIYPVAGNEAAVGLDYRTHPTQHAAAQQAMDTGEMVIAGPLPLVQGGVGIVARLPVFLPPAKVGQPPRPWGLVSAVIDADALYRQSGIVAAASTLQIALRGTDGTGSLGPVFFGDPALFDDDPVLLDVTLPNGSWQMAGVPRLGWGQVSRQVWQFRGPALLFGALFTLAVYSLTRTLLTLRDSGARLRKNEARLIEAESIAHVGNWEYEVAARHIDWSDELYRIFGLEPRARSISYAWLRTRIHPEDRRAYEAYLRGRLTGQPNEAIAELRCRIRTAKDEERHLSVRARVLHDGTGRPVRLFGTTQDITKQAQLESALRTSEQRLSTLIDNLPGVVYRCRNTPDWPMDYISPTIEDLLGHPAEAFREGALKFGDFIHPADRDRVWQRVQAGVTAGSPYALEYRMLDRDGQMHWVWEQGQAVSDETGTVELEGFITDITERKQRESQVAQLHAILNALVQGSTDLIFVKDRDGRYLLANQEVSRRIDIPLEAIVGRTDYDLFPADLAERFRADDSRIMAAGLTETYEEPLQVPGATLTHLTTKGALVIDGEVQGVFGISRDITNRKRDEQRLRDSEARLNEAQRQARLGSWELDPVTMSGAWSDEMYHLTGFEPAAGPPDFPAFLDWVHPDDRERVRAHFRAVAHRGETWSSVEFRCRPARGGDRYFLGRATAVRDGAGQVLRLTGTTQEITDLRQAEDQARRGQAVLESVFESLPDLFFLMDADGTIRDFRAQRLAELYVPPQRFIGQRIQDVLPTRVANRFDELMERVRRDGGLVSGEYDLAMPHGQRHYEARISRLAGSEQFVAVVRDMTDQHRARQALAESEERFSRALDNIPDVVTIRDRELRIQYVNSAIRTLTDLPAADLIGRRDDEVWPPEICDAYLPTLRTALASGTTQLIEVDIDFPAAGPRSLDIVYVPLLDRDGQVREILSVSHDFTERKQAETQIRELNAELEDRVLERTAELAAANREMEAFTYAVSHDLRAPLRAIQGFEQALVEDYGDQLPAGAIAFLEEIHTGGVRMGELIEGLLELSRGTRGTLNRESVALDAMARDILARLARAEPDRQVRLETRGDLQVWGDSRLLKTLLQNLLDNAWKYTRYTATAEIVLSAETIDGEDAICVADNGAGFDNAFAAKLFQPFQRLHHQDEFPGIGIGLATVARIVHRHGGWIRGWGEPNHGARFCFTLTPRSGDPT